MSNQRARAQDMQFRGVPIAVVEHYEGMKRGYRQGSRHSHVVSTFVKHWSTTDEATMLRLLTHPEMQDVWKAVSEILPDDKQRIRFFDSAWVSALDYDQFRFLTVGKGKRRKNEMVKLAAKIKATAEKLSKMCHAMTKLGNTPALPDKSLNSTQLEAELAWLIEKADRFDADSYNPDSYVNAAIAKQERNPVREYLRAFVTLLAEFGFPLDNPKAIGIIQSTATAATNRDSGVSYHDVYPVLQDLRKKSEK